MQGVKGTGSDKERKARWSRKHRKTQAQYLREWRKSRPGYLGPKRQALVDYVKKIKEDTPCKDCEKKFPACCMDFDHRPGEKSNEITTMLSRTSPLPEIQTEIDKCDIVCANCHRIRTTTKGSAGWTRRAARPAIGGTAKPRPP